MSIPQSRARAIACCGAWRHDPIRKDISMVTERRSEGGGTNTARRAVVAAGARSASTTAAAAWAALRLSREAAHVQTRPPTMRCSDGERDDEGGSGGEGARDGLGRVGRRRGRLRAAPGQRRARPLKALIVCTTKCDFEHVAAPRSATSPFLLPVTPLFAAWTQNSNPGYPGPRS